MHIQATTGEVILLDEEDAELAGLRWNVNQGRSAYARRSAWVQGRASTVLLHREIMARVLARTLKSGEVVDHIDGNHLNNRRSNLRLATRSENARNRKRHTNNKSGFKGVRLDRWRSKWIAEIQVNGKRKHLGTFATPELAHKAYSVAARELHGEFANSGQL